MLQKLGHVCADVVHRAPRKLPKSPPQVVDTVMVTEVGEGVRFVPMLYTALPRNRRPKLSMLVEYGANFFGSVAHLGVD